MSPDTTKTRLNIQTSKTRRPQGETKLTIQGEINKIACEVQKRASVFQRGKQDALRGRTQKSDNPDYLRGYQNGLDEKAGRLNPIVAPEGCDKDEDYYNYLHTREPEEWKTDPAWNTGNGG